MTKQLKPCPFCGSKCDVVTGLGGNIRTPKRKRKKEWSTK